MKRNLIQTGCAFLVAALVVAVAPPCLLAQAAAGAPVSYASMSQLNGMLSQLEQTSQATQIDLAKLRIEHWKTDSRTKHQLQSDVDALARNMKYALPDITAQLRTAPENVAVSFKLYENLCALYDVLNSVVESAGAFGSSDDYQTLSGDLSGFNEARHALGDRVENLAGQQEAELSRLRTELHRALTIINSTPPKKVVIDDNASEKSKHHSHATTSKGKSNSTKSSPGKDKN